MAEVPPHALKQAELLLRVTAQYALDTMEAYEAIEDGQNEAEAPKRMFYKKDIEPEVIIAWAMLEARNWQELRSALGRPVPDEAADAIVPPMLEAFMVGYLFAEKHSMKLKH